MGMILLCLFGDDPSLFVCLFCNGDGPSLFVCFFQIEKHISRKITRCATSASIFYAIIVQQCAFQYKTNIYLKVNLFSRHLQQPGLAGSYSVITIAFNSFF